MDISKLLREPVNNLNWVDTKTIHYRVSPDNNFKIAFSHFREERMGWYDCLFNLLDNNENIVGNYAPLMALSKKNSCWTDDSNYFALAAHIGKTYGYFIYKLPTH